MYALALTLTLAMTGQPPAPDTKPAREAAEERLELMKSSVKGYTLSRTSDSRTPIELRADPAFRLGPQGNGGILEGAIFLWTDPTGRPEAAAQVFLHRYQGRPDGEWHHEFTSLSTVPFEATLQGARRWWPAEAGVEFKPLPGAPKPAATEAQRLRQMRAMAADFRAEDNFGDKGWEVLRLLTTPIARYGKSGKTPEDGALFAFVEGTDPELFLFLEVRKGATGPEWQFALAPMSCWALKAEYKGQVVWSLPLRDTSNPSKPFFDLTYRPDADEPR
jgi:hypothetical protein